MSVPANEISPRAQSAGTPKISCIVPVYKVEKYLRECVDSVLAQTFTDFELILVDDGSPDNSGKICDDYAQKDARVRVFHKTNGGVSSARKMGVERSRGEWICFVDADDAIYSDAFEVLFSWTKNDDVDLVEGGDPRSLWRGSNFRGKAKLVRNVGALDYAEQLSAWRGDWLTSPWNKLFRRKTFLEADALNVAPEFFQGEDFLMCLRFARKMRKAVKIKRSLYFYRLTFSPQRSSRSRLCSMDYAIRWLEEGKRILFSGEVWHGAWVALLEYWFCRTFLFYGDWNRVFPSCKKYAEEISRERWRFCWATRVVLFFACRAESRIERILRRSLFCRRTFLKLWRVFRRPAKL